MLHGIPVLDWMRKILRATNLIAVHNGNITVTHIVHLSIMIICSADWIVPIVITADTQNGSILLVLLGLIGSSGWEGA